MFFAQLSFMKSQGFVETGFQNHEWRNIIIFGSTVSLIRRVLYKASHFNKIYDLFLFDVYI